MDRTRAVLLAIGLLAAVLGPVGSAAAATGNVDVDDYGYAPGEVRIEPGDRVRWTNEGSQAHTVTSDDPAVEDFDSGRLGAGDEYSHTFNSEGTYSYHCEVHSSMNAVVQVGSQTTTSSSTTTTTTTQPAPTTTTQPVPTTTTTRTAPTATTVPPSPTTTATTGRPPAAAGSPAPPATSAPTTTTRPPATTTTAPVESTTTTAAGETTTSSAPATTAPATPLGPEVPPRAPPQEEDGEGDLAGQGASPPLSRRSDGGANAGIILLVFALAGAGAFGGWTLWKLRPGGS